MDLDMKIYVRKNKFVISSSHFKGEMICKDAAELDAKMHEITNAFPDTTLGFSQGALEKYMRDIDSIQPLINMGFKLVGYVGDGWICWRRKDVKKIKKVKT